MKTKIAVIMISSFFYFPLQGMYECISLGESCTVAAALEAFELRNAAYPFDWTISFYESLCNTLEQDFEDFLNPTYFSIRPDNRGIINKYGQIFVHDFPTYNYLGDFEKEENPINGDVLHPDWIQFLPQVQEKYNRRIQRFRSICNSNKKIYFIRHMGIIDQDQACRLRNILKTAYPNLDFILVIIGNNSYFAEPWNEPNIRNYYLGNPAVWNDVAEWKKIFIDLGLISSIDKHIPDPMYTHNKFLSLLEKYQSSY
jgi:hypothetical protein